MEVTGKPVDVVSTDLSSVSSGWTHMEENKFSYTWTIDNFRCHFKKLDSVIESPEFTTGCSDGPTCCLVLRSCTEPSVVMISLKVVKLDQSDMQIQFDFCLMNNENEAFKMVDPNYYDLNKTSVIERKLIERNRLLDKNNCHVIDDKVTILCTGKVLFASVNISGRNIANPFEVPDCSALNNLGIMFGEQKFCDITLSVKGREFRAHKVILVAQCSRFAEMCENAMTDLNVPNKNRLEITDIDFKVLKVMLDFIYTGKATIKNKMAGELLMAADKYGLGRLKVMCENKLATTLSVNNAIDIMILADLHSAFNLKQLVMDFIVVRARTIMDTLEFKSLLQAHPALGAETFKTLAGKRILQTPKTSIPEDSIKNDSKPSLEENLKNNRLCPFLGAGNGHSSKIAINRKSSMWVEPYEADVFK